MSSMADKTSIDMQQAYLLTHPVAYAESLELPFGKLYDWQKDVLNVRWGDVCINGARQAGKSTIVSVLPCHRAKYIPGSLSIVIAPTLPQAAEDMGKIRAVIQRDEHFPQMLRGNDSELKFDNGSRIVVAPATDAARGKSAPCLVILDEASRIEDFVFSEVVLPMFTKSKRYLFIRISTPNGKKGFFYDDFNDPQVKRFEVRSPYDVSSLDNYTLIPAKDEKIYKQEMAAKGIFGYYSPQHRDFEKQSKFLQRMGKLRYQQEFCGEFVEPEDQVFSYSDIEAVFNSKASPDIEDFGQADPEEFFDARGAAV